MLARLGLLGSVGFAEQQPRAQPQNGRENHGECGPFRSGGRDYSRVVLRELTFWEFAIWVPIFMKTTIDIADDIFSQVQELARKEKTTFRSLTEAALRNMLLSKQEKKAKKVLPPLVTSPGGLSEEFKNATWDDIMEEIYPLPKL
jgi:hypothetical protein